MGPVHRRTLNQPERYYGLQGHMTAGMKTYSLHCLAVDWKCFSARFFLCLSFFLFLLKILTAAEGNVFSFYTPPSCTLPSSSLWAAAVLDFFLPHSNDRISPERKGSPKIFTHHKNFGGCHLPLAGKARSL